MPVSAQTSYNLLIMRIWLITIGEPVPLDGQHQVERLHRTGYFANFLKDHGHDVTWWTSTFDHFKKRHLFSTDTTVRISASFKVKLIKGHGYRRNISLARILDHHCLAKKLSKCLKDEEPPDIILSSLPAVELCRAAVCHGQKRKVPVVLDMRDMWPDIFSDSVNKVFKPLVRVLSMPMYKQAQYACAHATAIFGITEAYVDWGVKRGKRKRTSRDKAFPLGYTNQPPNIEAIAEAEKYWDDRGVVKNMGSFVVTYIGTIARWADLETVIRAAKRLRAVEKRILFVLCGDGETLDYYRQQSFGCPNVILPGWINAAQIYVLLRRSSVGLDPLPNRYDFLATINNKAIEYLSAGLPVVSSPDHGVLSRFLKDNECGTSYPTGDVHALTGKLLSLDNNREILERMSNSALSVYRSQFIAERIYEDMMILLAAIAEEHRIRL